MRPAVRRRECTPPATLPIASSTMTSTTKDTAEHTAEPAAEHTIDIHTTAGKLADLRRRDRGDAASGR